MDEAKERGSREALAIENAETRILSLSKRAILEMWSKERYVQEVEKVIKETRKAVPEIAGRIDKPLKDYATKCIYKQKQLLDYQASFLAMLVIANQDYSIVEKMIGEEVLKSEGFTREVNERLFYDVGMPRGEYMKTYMEDVKKMTEDLVSMNAQEDYDSNVNLRNIAEMTVRYESQVDMINGLKKNGTRLAWIEPHANCSERCEPYQGKLYSLDGTEGNIDGIHYMPLEYATDNPRDRYVTRKGVVYQNGCITGFNCRHRLIPYEKGVKPAKIPADVIENQRAINDKQREYERKIRYAKKMAVELSGSEDGKAWKRRAKQAAERYKTFCRENEVAYYPERIKIIEGY